MQECSHRVRREWREGQHRQVWSRTRHLRTRNRSILAFSTDTDIATAANPALLWRLVGRRMVAGLPGTVYLQG